jgi:uncharacterized SAM-binding protein YcdF (DUF218 family)
MYEFLRTVGYFIINPHHQLVLLVLAFTAALYFRHRVAKHAGVILLLHVLFFSSKFGLFLTLRPLENAYDLPRNAVSLDAVVVLSGGTVQFDPVNSLYSWEPNAARVLEAIRLYKASQSQFFVISGATPEYAGSLLPEAESMKRLAVEWGIPEDKIVVEPKAPTTQFHPVELKPLLAEKNITSFYLVTSAFHLPRAVRAFEKQGYHPVPFPVGKFYPYLRDYFDFDYYSLERWAIHEWVGLIAYSVRGAI